MAENRLNERRAEAYDPFMALFNEYFDDRTNSNFMRTDIVEDNDKYVLEVEIPGFEKNDINITLDEGYLAINAKSERKQVNGRYIRAERNFGKYSRKFYVGNNVTKGDITAEYNNGLLIVTVNKPKEQPVEDRTIAIR